MTQRISFTVQGQVQGVNFRSFTQQKAAGYGLTGWVSNTSGGDVEGEAQGDRDSIQKLLSDINKGPSAAHVVKVNKSDIDIKEGESSFEAN
ncbi:acylphosphatase [Physcia stellaris]|nr:acylphosphatase [Physcia stellaris]